MTSKAEPIPGSRSTISKIAMIVPEPQLRAPFVLRCAALLIDYLVVTFIPVCFLIFARFLGGDGSKLLNSDLNSLGWLLALLIGIANIVILPAIIGQSAGKLLCGIRIVGRDGKEPSAAKVILRQTVGYLLTVLTFGIGFFLTVFSSSGRSLNDLLFGTIVILAQKQKLKS